MFLSVSLDTILKVRFHRGFQILDKRNGKFVQFFFRMSDTYTLLIQKKSRKLKKFIFFTTLYNYNTYLFSSLILKGIVRKRMNIIKFLDFTEPA